MKKKPTKFTIYLQSLNEEEQNLVNVFFEALQERLDLSKNDERLMKNDLEQALLYYHEQNVPLTTALERLHNDNLGGFYARPPILWYKLDDAARIYPLAMRHGQMTVFRLSATLFNDIVPELLQIALTFTIKRFPRFATSLKKGFFWHYLEPNKKRYQIEKEQFLPCRPLKISSTSASVFRVIYFEKRISVEFFHVLTDGTGGMAFLKSLLATYLELVGKQFVNNGTILAINDTTLFEEENNEFSQKTGAKKISGFNQKRSLQMSGRLSGVKPVQVLHFRLNSQALKNISKKYNVTINTYMLGLVALAARHSTDARKGDIALQVPVNMRKFYNSKTLTNFSLYASVRLPIANINNLNEVLISIDEQTKEKANLEKMSEMMHSTYLMNKGLRFIPLFLKNPIAKIIYGFIGEKIFTTTLSNLGVIQTPEEFKDYVEYFDFVLGPPQVNRVSLTLSSFNEITTFTLTKVTRDPSFETEMLRLLKQDGLEVNIEGSNVYGR